MEPHQPDSPSFSVQRVETKLIKPSQPTSLNTTLSFSTIDNNPNLEFISHVLYVFKAKDEFLVHGSNNLEDPAYIIQESLSKLLIYYYPLAGKLKRHKDGQLRICCSGEGVPFAVAIANCTLSSVNYFTKVEVDTGKYLLHEESFINDKDEKHPLLLQVTKFSCGGFTIGMGMSHSVFDGFGAGQFIRAMTELATDKIEPSVKPVWERERLIGTMNSEKPTIPLSEIPLAKSPYLPSTELQHEFFGVSSESINRLKMSLMKEIRESYDHQGFSESLTTLEVLSAFVWRSRFRALRLISDSYTKLSIAVGIRRLVVPPLPDGYYGNAFVPAQIMVLGKELCEGPLSNVVKMIKESKKNSSKMEYILDCLGFLERANQNGENFDQPSGATMVLTDWRQLGLSDLIDFGWKQPVNMTLLPSNLLHFVDICMFLPPCNLDPSTKGGVRVFVCLPIVAMIKFKEEMDALKLDNFKL